MTELEAPLLPIIFEDGEQVRHDGRKGADCCSICCCLIGLWPCSIARHASTSLCNCRFKPLKSAWICFILNCIFSSMSMFEPRIPGGRFLRVLRGFAIVEAIGYVCGSYILWNPRGTSLEDNNMTLSGMTSCCCNIGLKGQRRLDGRKGAGCLSICCCVFWCCIPCSISRHAKVPICNYLFQPLQVAWILWIVCWIVTIFVWIDVLGFLHASDIVLIIMGIV